MVTFFQGTEGTTYFRDETRQSVFTFYLCNFKGKLNISYYWH